MNDVLHARALLPAADGMAPLDFTVEAGKVICLVSRDVSLRSAYLRALAGAAWPQAGELELLGRRLSALGEQEWLALRRHVGLVMREAPLVSSMDGLRNVTLPAQYHGLGDRAKCEALAREWLARLGFGGDAQGLPAFLDELDRKILALARALILEPKLLFLDDPLHGLHGRAAHQATATISAWSRAAGATLVYATDDAEFIRAFADRILFLAPPAAQLFDSWTAFHDSRDPKVQDYFAEFRTEARAFD